MPRTWTVFVSLVTLLALCGPCLATKTKAVFPVAPHYEAKVKELIQDVDAKNLEDRVTFLTSIQTRYYLSQYGEYAASWGIDTLREIAGDRLGKDISVRVVVHSWPQPSAIARIEGVGSLAEQVVILGAHIDSSCGFCATNERAPGADSDASGMAALLEAYRIIIDATNGNTDERRSIEFHVYAAEDVRLQGSREIAADYKKRGVDVYAMIMFDMIGYTERAEPVIGVMTDYTNPELTSFLRLVVDTYCDIPYVNSKCDTQCSSHVNWFLEGYATAYPFEGPYEERNPFVLSNKDVKDLISYEHIKQFVHIALGFAYELMMYN